MKICIATACFIFLSITIFTSAVSAENYFGITGGYFFPNDDYRGLRLYSDGYSTGMVYGYCLSEIFTLEGSMGYIKAIYYREYWMGACLEYPCGIASLTTDKVTIMPISITAKAGYTVSGIFRFYAGVGVGYYYTSFTRKDVSVIAQEDRTLTYEIAKRTEKKDKKGFHIMAGMDIELTNKLSFGFQGRRDYNRPGHVWGFPPGEGHVNFGGITAGISLKYRI